VKGVTFPTSASGYALKRAFDLCLAISGLVILSPVFLCAAVTIRLGSRGSVLFRQERIGQNEMPFNILKLRTMVVGAAGSGPGKVSLRNDPRLFRGAHTLRRFKIDELPQLVNVLHGTMSIVGPRPTVREDYLRMNETQRKRFLVKPGMTGLAQLNGNTALLWPERIKYDLAYVSQSSLGLDVKIFLRTVWLTVTGKVETHPLGVTEWPD
jgi:lipopolysaccharide/colanic/teichoic acid biosynthesis glycosyltransferase